MIDITKKWKTRCGWPVTGLHAGPEGVLRGSVVFGLANVRFAEWNPASGRCIHFGMAPLDLVPFDLVPAEDEPAAPPLPPLDARLFLTGCVLAGMIASADETSNPDPRACTKWALDFVDGVLAELEKRKAAAQ